VTNLVVAVALGGAALLVAWLINRRKPKATPMASAHHVPDRIDRGDFARPDAPVLVAVFTSATCASCAAMVATARELASDAVTVDEAEAGARGDVHRRYEIDAVPIAVVADRYGLVCASFAGSMGLPDLRDAIAQASTR
jgi:hypothetical protein